MLVGKYYPLFSHSFCKNKLTDSWSVALAAPLGCFPDPYLIFKFGLGSLIMRSAGCIINDMMDKDFDALVERTKNRPIASGAITMPQVNLRPNIIDINLISI